MILSKLDYKLNHRLIPSIRVWWIAQPRPSRMKALVVSTRSVMLIQGSLTPLVGIGACVSIQFAALETLKRAFGAEKKPLSLYQLFLCGAGSGLANSVLSGPIGESFSCRARTYSIASASHRTQSIQRPPGPH